jgi:branched-chain amino acid transport system ATP-binding protein
LNTISGILPATSGKVEYLEEDITNMAPQIVVRKGIVQVPEGRKIFTTMSVMENLEMGAYSLDDRKQIYEKIDEMFQKFPILGKRSKQLGGTLSGGEQQMLAIARGLMAKPKLILLDEPSMGLAPILVEQIFDIIQDINQHGTSVLLVEQNAQMALSIANRAYVLETGRIILDGDAKKLMKNPIVIEAYLGG